MVTARGQLEVFAVEAGSHLFANLLNTSASDNHDVCSRAKAFENFLMFRGHRGAAGGEGFVEIEKEMFRHAAILAHGARARY